MPFAQFHYPFEGEEEFRERFPADFISEAIDQTRGWFYSLLAVSTLVFDRSSYRNCVCLGLILDPEGQKMSKSRGNVVDPWDVIDRHGADAFRWYLLTAQQPWAGYRFSSETIGESLRQFLLTLWNTYSFWVLYANAEGVDGGGADECAGGAGPTWIAGPSPASRPPPRPSSSAWTTSTARRAGRAIADYVEELSNWYVRLSRRRFWDGDRAALGNASPLPDRGGEAPRALRAVRGRRDPRQPRGGDSVHLRDYPAPRRRRSTTRARGGDGGRAADGRARPHGARRLPDQDAPAASPRDRGRERGRARGDLEPAATSSPPS